MKLLFVFTGGTIGSTADGEIITIDHQKPYVLLEEYSKRYPIDFAYTATKPYSILSENNSGKELRMLCDCVQSHLGDDYDGIVVTHGTDTLQYSAAALSYTVGSSSIPICLVSSNFTIEDARSNAMANLHGAVEFIRRGCEKGVWVSYQNTNDCIRIHRASRLLASDAFSADIFSAQDCWYGCFDAQMHFTKNPAYRESEDGMASLSTSALAEQCESIVRIEPYVGMTYPELGSKVRYVLLGSYHSGTVNTVSPSARAFYEKAHQKGVTVFLTGVTDGTIYESAKSFDELHIIPIPDISPIGAYVKLWLCADSEQVVKMMNTPLGGDK